MQIGKKLVLAAILALSVTSVQATWTEAHEEVLEKEGVIPDFNKSGTRVGHWEIKGVEGENAIFKDQKEALAQAKVIFVSQFDGTLQRRMYDQFQQGYRHIKQSWKEGVLQVDDRVRAARKEIKENKGKFGSRLHFVKTVCGTSGQALRLLGHTVVGTVVGATEAVARPTATFVWQEVQFGTNLIAKGAVLPALRLVRQEADEWLIKTDGEPEPGNILFTYVSEVDEESDCGQAAAVN